jgi:hypothetical protein
MLVMFSSLVLQGTIAVRVPLVFGASSNLEHRLSHLPRLRLAPRQVVDSAGDDVVAYNTPPADDPVQTAIAFNKMWDSAGMVGWKITGPGHGFTLVRLDDWQGAVASSPLSHLGFHAPIVFTTSSTQLPDILDAYYMSVAPTFLWTPADGPYNMTYVIGSWDQISWPLQAHVDNISEMANRRDVAVNTGGRYSDSQP